jgi:hypothetical protein
MTHENPKTLLMDICHVYVSLIFLKLPDSKSIVAFENSAQDLVKLPELRRIDKQGTISLNERPQSVFVIKGLAGHGEQSISCFRESVMCHAQRPMLACPEKQEDVNEEQWGPAADKPTCSMTG